MFTDIQRWFRDLLNSPPRVALYALIIVFFALIIDGSAFQYWTLVREHRRLQQSIRVQEKQSDELAGKIKQAKGLEFVEHQARDRLDLVNDDELVFVFSDDLPISAVTVAQ